MQIPESQAEYDCVLGLIFELHEKTHLYYIGQNGDQFLVALNLALRLSGWHQILPNTDMIAIQF